jgi:hypothetical protein
MIMDEQFHHPGLDHVKAVAWVAKAEQDLPFADGQHPEQLCQGNALFGVQQGEKFHLVNEIRNSHKIPFDFLDGSSKQTVDVCTSTVC